MNQSISGRDAGFFICCLLLGGLAELSFFHSNVGVSYLLFLFGFYSVFFMRFRRHTFGQRRMGMLVMFVILVLAAHYLLYDNELFKFFNGVLIPVLVVAHMVLITKPKHISWYHPMFVKRFFYTFRDAFPYYSAFITSMYNSTFKHMDRKKSDVIKKVLLGIVIGGPLLIVIIGLLMQADQAFQELLGNMPHLFMNLQINVFIVRGLIVLSTGSLFFAVFQVLTRDRGEKEQEKDVPSKGKHDGIVSLTILILLNLVYLLFTVVQFTYFFGGELHGGMSYAEYARRGFFELLMVTLVNLTTLVIMLYLNKPESKPLGIILKIMYSFLIAFSGVLLVSAFQRLTLYEQHYGYTMDRVLPHVFMVFLIVIFIYTLVKVWVEYLSLVHFYIITGLLFYAGLNAVNVEQWIVDRNLERYEETGKIDIDYLDSMSYTGVDGLMDLYEMEPDYPRLEELLGRRKEEWLSSPLDEWQSWQSYNVQRDNVLGRLENWDH